MTNIGTLFAFVIVCAAVLIMQDAPGSRASVPLPVRAGGPDSRDPELPAADVLAAGGKLVRRLSGWRLAW